MRRVGQTRRRDINEPAVVDALEAVGAKVMRVSGPGVPDLIVLFRARVWLMEVKGAQGQPTPAQAQRSADGWPVYTARTPEQALGAIGAIR